MWQGEIVEDENKIIVSGPFTQVLRVFGAYSYSDRWPRCVARASNRHWRNLSLSPRVVLPWDLRARCSSYYLGCNTSFTTSLQSTLDPLVTHRTPHTKHASLRCSRTASAPAFILQKNVLHEMMNLRVWVQAPCPLSSNRGWRCYHRLSDDGPLHPPIIYVRPLRKYHAPHGSWQRRSRNWKSHI